MEKVHGRLALIDDKAASASFPERRLQQLNLLNAGRSLRSIEGFTPKGMFASGTHCHLSETVRRDFYSSRNNTWKLNESLIDEVDSDLQSVVDCAISMEAMIYVAEGIQVPVRETIKIHGSLNITGATPNEANMPIFTCPGGNQILSIR